MKVTSSEILDGAAPYTAKKIRTAATIAACRALTGLTDGELVLVAVYGLYRYDASSTDTADEKIILTPDTLPGRFINDTAYGITYLI